MPELKLGKRPVRKDIRTIKLATILKVLPPIPDAFNVDSQFPGLVDNNSYNNTKYGDCVIAGRAHMTLRFEHFEQQALIPITDKDVVDEYFKETGGPDHGLVMLDSLNAWRRSWKAAEKDYNIYAYASLTPSDHNEVKATIYLLSGLYVGIELPLSAQSQAIWDVDNGPNGSPGSWGGHCVYIFKYDNDFLTCVTWGKEQKMTWAFFDKYCSEGYAIVDNRDVWVSDSPVDVDVLDQILHDIAGAPLQQLVVITMSLPAGTVGVPYSANLYAEGGTPPYKWTCNGLPTGLSLADDGTISGTPAAAMTVSNILFMVSDSVGNQSGVILSITINSAPTPSSCKVGNTIAKAMNTIFLQKLRRRKGRFAYMNNIKED